LRLTRFEFWAEGYCCTLYTSLFTIWSVRFITKNPLAWPKMPLCFRMIITTNSVYCAIPIRPSDKSFYRCQSFTIPQPTLRFCVVPVCPSKQIQGHYGRNNSTKFPASGAGRVSEPRLMSGVRESTRNHVRVDQCVSAVRTVEVPVFFSLRRSCNHVTETDGPQDL